MSSLCTQDPVDKSGAEEDDQKDQQKDEGEKGEDAETGEYEFSAWEERVLQVVMDSLRMAALALGMQAISSVLLGNLHLSPCACADKFLHITHYPMNKTNASNCLHT